VDDPRLPTEPVRHRPETVLVPLPQPPPRFGLPDEMAPGPSHARPRRRRALLWTVLAGVVVVALVVVGVVVLTGRGTGAGPPAPGGPGGPGVPPPTSAAPSPSVARASLDEQVGKDAPRVAPLLDRWVPQLYAGGGATDVDAQEALTRYRAAVAAHPGALLLSSTDYSSFEKDGFYVVVMPMPYPTAAEAIAWCRAQSLGAAACYAKRISRTVGPAGSTVYR